MFNQLVNFGYTRTKKQAFGFYIAYLILFMLAGFVLGAIGGVLSPDNAFELGLKLGTVMACVLSAVVCSLVVAKKNIFSFKYILLIIASALLGLFAGAFLGLVIPAILTTKQS